MSLSVKAVVPLATGLATNNVADIDAQVVTGRFHGAAELSPPRSIVALGDS